MSVCVYVCVCMSAYVCLWLWSSNQVSTVRGKLLAEIGSSVKRIHLSWTFLSISHHSWYNTWHLEGAQSVIASCLRGHRVALFRLWLHCMIHCLSRIEEIKSYSKSLQCYGLETEVRICYIFRIQKVLLKLISALDYMFNCLSQKYISQDQYCIICSKWWGLIA